MSYNLKLEGFPTLGISDILDTPDVADLLRLPTIFEMRAEDVYKYGGEIYCQLLDKTPLTHRRKYTYVSAKLQYLTPTKTPIPNNDWHCDPGIIAPFNGDVITHILACGSKQITSLTEFFDRPVSITCDESVLQMGHRQFREYLTDRIDTLNIRPIPIPTDRFVTFTSKHAHRAVNPTKNEFRFFWRVVETDTLLAPSQDIKNTLQPEGSKVWQITNHDVFTQRNIEYRENHIIIHDK